MRILKGENVLVWLLDRPSAFYCDQYKNCDRHKLVILMFSYSYIHDFSPQYWLDVPVYCGIIFLPCTIVTFCCFVACCVVIVIF